LAQLGIVIASVGAEEIAAHCPFHSDTHPSFSINATSGLWICHQCSERGNLEMLLQKVGSGTTAISLEGLIRQVRRTKRVAPPPPPPLDPYTIFAQYEACSHPPAWALEERQFSQSVAERFGIRWDRGWILPIWDPVVTHPAQQLRGWQFKRLDLVSNYPKSVKKSTTLFGLHVFHGPSVALVESPLDVARLAAVGVPAVAAFGAFVSTAQVRLIVDAAEKVVLALDNDTEGQRQTQRLYRTFGKLLPVSVVRYPEHAKDPGDLSDDEVVDLFS